jgi:hypothetical protein
LGAGGQCLCVIQGALKSPGLIGLKEPPVEQHDGAVAECQNADNKKKDSGPTKK